MKCELCDSTNGVTTYNLPKPPRKDLESFANICSTCKQQIESSVEMDPNHWRCLNSSMWSERPAVQVLSWQMLNRLQNENWAGDLLQQFYLDEDILSWAKSLDSKSDSQDNTVVTKDSNGTTLLDGDSVTLIKDLDVKGANFTAKRGTLVKNISLTNNPEHIEGKVNGTQIVLKTCFLKKA